jgi:hypothetical protein
LYHESIADLQELTYKELQKVAKNNGVAANATKNIMIAAVKKAMLANVQATAPAAAPTTPMPIGPDGGHLDWASYKAHYANLEHGQDQLTPDVTLSVQWAKYKEAFATKVAKEKEMAEKDTDMGQNETYV